MKQLQCDRLITLPFVSQINEIDEYGPSKDNILGHKFIWKIPSDYDHWDIDDRIVKAACSLNEKLRPDMGIAIGRNGTMATLGYV